MLRKVGEKTQPCVAGETAQRPAFPRENVGEVVDVYGKLHNDY